MERPVPPRPECVDGGGSRLDWDQYHIACALYYDNVVLTLDEMITIRGAK